MAAFTRARSGEGMPGLAPLVGGPADRPYPAPPSAAVTARSPSQCAPCSRRSRLPWHDPSARSMPGRCPRRRSGIVQGFDRSPHVSPHGLASVQCRATSFKRADEEVIKTQATGVKRLFWYSLWAADNARLSGVNLCDPASMLVI